MKDQVRWSVGTSKFLALERPANQFITEVQVFADLSSRPPVSSIQFQRLEMLMTERDSPCREMLISPALPEAIRAQVPVKGDDVDPVPLKPKAGNRILQVAQFRFTNPLADLRIDAQVSMNANFVYGWEEDLGPDSIKGGIKVYSKPIP